MKRIFLLALLFATSHVQAENFGRLFTSPEERRLLDGIRLNQSPEEALTPVSRAPVPTITNAPSELRFSGYIQRQDGSYAIWVNGQSELSKQDSPIEQAKFLKSPEATLTTQGLQATMRPGQIWSLESNTVREGYYIERKPTQDPVTEPEKPGS